jgi:branched-chain amino acid transport system ATP-binding protein
MSAAVALSVRNLTSRVGQGIKLFDVSLEVREKELVAILGANGAGKSTLLNVIAGRFKPTSGSVRLGERDITGMRAHEVVKNGLVLAPQNHPIFESLTVDENLGIGSIRLDPGIFDAFPNLKQKRHLRAGLLSGGERQMLSMAQALLTKPKVYLLDEPSSGLAPKIVHLVFEATKQLVKAGSTVLMVEQNARAALVMSDRVYVMERGRIVLEGASSELSENDHIRRAYLGL